VRQIRAGIIGQLSGVDTIARIPFGIVPHIRQQAVALLGDPKAFPFEGRGCGGDDPGVQPSRVQETEIAHFED